MVDSKQTVVKLSQMKVNSIGKLSLRCVEGEQRAEKEQSEELIVL